MDLLTSVIVLAVTAESLQPGGAVRPVPARPALAPPLPVEVCPALAVVGAHVGAALYGAVTTVPSRHTETGPVLALTVLLAPDNHHHDGEGGEGGSAHLASQSLF